MKEKTSSSPSPLGEQLLRDCDVAKKFAVSTRCVIDWRNSGKLNFIRIGRSVRYKPESIRSLLEKLERGGN